MADKEIKFETKGAREAGDALDRVADKSKKADASLQKSSKTSATAAKSAGKLKLGLLAVAAAFTMLAAKTAAAVQSAATFIQVQGQLAVALAKTDDAAGSVTKAMIRANRVMRDFEKFGVSVREQTDVLETLVRTTGNYEESLAGLKLAIDINAQTSIGLETATKALQKAYQGETRAIKQLGILTRDQARDLDKISDGSERAKVVIGLLSDEFGGAAEKNKGLADKLDQTNAELDRMQVAAGRVAIAFGEEGVGLTSELGQFLGVIEEGKSVTGDFADRLEKLADLAEAGDFAGLAERLAPAVGLLNPATAPAALAALSQTTRTGEGGGPATPVGPAGETVPDSPEQQPVGPMDDLARAINAPAEEGGSGGGPDTRTGFTGGTGITDDEIMAEVDSVLEQAAEREQEFADQRATRANNAKQEQIAIWKEEQEAFRERQEEIAKLREEDADHQKKISEELKKAKQAQAEADQQAAVTGIAASGQLAQAFLKNEGLKAAISGAIATARSIEAFAPPVVNVPGGIMHAAAAAQFFAAAAMAGAGGGGGAKSKGGGGGGASSGGSRSSAPTAEEREPFRLAGEGARASNQAQPAALTINVNSAFPPSPGQTRELFDAVEQERRRRV